MANTDFFVKGARRFSTTLGSGGFADASATTAAVTTFPSDYSDTDVVAIVVDRVDLSGTLTPDKEEVIVGVKSGSNIINCLRGVEGTAQAHVAGAVVEIKLFKSVWNRLIEGILEEHAQDGTHDSTKVAMLAGSQTFTGTKTFDTAPKLTFGSEAAGDTFYGAADGTLTRLAKGSDGQYLKLASGVPSWATISSGGAIQAQDTDGTSSTTSSTAADITGASASVTTSVTSHILILGTVQGYANPGSTVEYFAQLHNGTGGVGNESQATLQNGNKRMIIPLMAIEASKAAGTYTYTLRHRNGDNTTSCTAEKAQINIIAIPA